ncbi:MAG: PilX N-terminal domain-containing pilus assembly protein [Gammaproteobacteria bacterium]
MTLTNRLPRRERGAALIIGLLLLLVLTVFAVSGMSRATLELALAGNTQFSENAFQAAESAIEAELVAGPSPQNAARVTDYSFGDGTNANSTVDFDATRLAPPGFSITEYVSDHYVINSTGTSGKNASTTNEQGFYVVVPSGI